MRHKNWKCAKCGNQDFDADQFRATGGMFSKLFDVQNKKFTTVSCSNCHYTEMYKTDQSKLGSIFDFIFGG